MRLLRCGGIAVVGQFGDGVGRQAGEGFEAAQFEFEQVVFVVGDHGCGLAKIEVVVMGDFSAQGLDSGQG